MQKISHDPLPLLPQHIKEFNHTFIIGLRTGPELWSANTSRNNWFKKKHPPTDLQKKQLSLPQRKFQLKGIGNAIWLVTSNLNPYHWEKFERQTKTQIQIYLWPATWSPIVERNLSDKEKFPAIKSLATGHRAQESWEYI